MALQSRSPHVFVNEITRRAGRLRVKLSQTHDGWMLEGLPFSMTQLGYPNLENSDTPGRVGALSLKAADHYLFLCEKRVRDSQISSGRPNGWLVR